MNTTAIIISIFIMLTPILFLWKYGLTTIKVRRVVTGILIGTATIAIVYMLSGF